MSKPLATNGLIPAADFPAAAYDAVHLYVTRKWDTHPHYADFGSAWNAVAYRFHAAADAGDKFHESLAADGSSPPPAQRYLQDTALADFFSHSYSAFESVFYGLHALGVFVAPASFSLATPKAQRQVSAKNTSEAFAKALPGDPLVAALDALLADPAYEEIGIIRNVLIHRTAPGRTMFVGIGVDDSPPTEWKLNNIAFDDAMIRDRRGGVAKTLTQIVEAMDDFGRRNP